jgi:hypothetical protein
MLHKFFEPGYWFAPKKLGYGAGLPIAWQGWALLISYMAVLLGAGLLLESGGQIGLAAFIAITVIVTILLLLIARRRTEGGWKWRG